MERVMQDPQLRLKCKRLILMSSLCSSVSAAGEAVSYSRECTNDTQANEDLAPRNCQHSDGEVTVR